MISDGDDNLSDHALSDAIDASIRSEASVYTISTNTDWLAVDDARKPSKYNMDAGDKFSSSSRIRPAGSAFFPYRIDDLAQSFLDIGTELRSQYFIAYSPRLRLPTANTARSTCRPPQRTGRSHQRKGYYAVASAFRHWGQ